MTLLVCIATQQEVTNLIPALELDARHVLSFATRHALASHWPAHLRDALRTIPLTAIPIDEALESSPVALAAQLLAAIKDHRLGEEPLCFAWAGGQKPVSLAFWLAFAQLHAHEPTGGHCAAYMETHTGRLLRWSAPDQPPVSTPLSRSLSIDELLACYGQETTENKKMRLLWPPEPLPEWLPACYDLYQRSQPMRRLCFERAEAAGRADVFDQGLDPEQLRAWIEAQFADRVSAGALEKLLDERWRPSLHPALLRVDKPLVLDLVRRSRNAIKDALLTPAHVLRVAIPDDGPLRAYLSQVNARAITASEPLRGLMLAPDIQKFSELFEFLIQHRVARWLESRSPYVHDVRANIEYRAPGAAGASGELDVAILARSGRLIALDAKTFLVDLGKTQRAQETSVRMAGGSFAQRFIVLPMHEDDIGAPEAAADGAGGDAQPWYPVGMVQQIKRARLRVPDAPAIVPFDGGDAFERALDRLCGVI
jgi:hypothetical protein